MAKEKTTKAKDNKKKLSNAAVLRQLSDAELQQRINELKQELFNLRFQASVGKLEKTADLRKVKKEIARCYTIQTERSSSNN